MNPDLEKRIRMVYPTGRIDKPNRRRLFGKKFETAVCGAVREIAEATSATYDEFAHWWEISRTLQFDFTLQGPRHDDWWCRLDDSQRISWLRENQGVYAILTLNISKVYPAYAFYFTIWKLVGQTEIDSDISYGLADTIWVPFFQELNPRFKQLGLVQLKECDREEEVLFVLCEESGDGIDEEERILVPATVHRCLFEEF